MTLGRRLAIEIDDGRFEINFMVASSRLENSRDVCQSILVLIVIGTAENFRSILPLGKEGRK